MERAPNRCEAGTTSHIDAWCVTDFSRSFPPHYGMFCPSSGFQTFLLSQRHILPVQALNTLVEETLPRSPFMEAQA